MHDVLLILPPVGPLHLYTTPEEKLSLVDQKWLRRLTRVPQGALSIASYLEQNGVSTKIFDSRFHLKNLKKDLIQAFKETRSLAGISVFTMHISFALQVSKLVRDGFPGFFMVWGGFHPTLYPEQTASEPLVDAVIDGEGEVPMLHLFEALTKGKSLRTVPSLVFRENNKIVKNPQAKPFNINSLERYRLECLELQHYLIKQSYNPDRKLLGIEYNGSRGCSYDCSFCINRVLPQQHIWRGRKPDKIVTDIQYLKDHYKIKYVFFEEELPFMNRKRSLELAAKIKYLDLQIYANIRADTVHRDKELLVKLRASGWSETSVGAESGSNRMLQYLNKGITVEQTLETAKILNALDVYCLYSFMTDLPTETTDEKLATFKLMRKLTRIHPKSEFIGPQAYRLYPKTAWYDQLVTEGKFKEPSTLREWVTSGLSAYYSR